MAQTKRKRRTKHRGNAAGTIEARGRTGRKPTADEQRKSAGAQRARASAAPPADVARRGHRAGFARDAVRLFQIGLAGDEQRSRPSLCSRSPGS